MVSFAGSGPNSRSTQMFVTLRDSNMLGKSPWETPFGNRHRRDGYCRQVVHGLWGC
eukprot:45543_1